MIVTAKIFWVRNESDKLILTQTWTFFRCNSFTIKWSRLYDLSRKGMSFWESYDISIIDCGAGGLIICWKQRDLEAVSRQRQYSFTYWQVLHPLVTPRVHSCTTTGELADLTIGPFTAKLLSACQRGHVRPSAPARSPSHPPTLPPSCNNSARTGIFYSFCYFRVHTETCQTNWSLAQNGRVFILLQHRNLNYLYIFKFIGVIGIFQWRTPSGRTMALGSTQPLTEMSTRCSSWG